jgi:hypothetical protein
VTCTGVSVCPGTLTGDVCVFERQLCVTCSNKSGVTYINVMSNGLPNHCTAGPSDVNALLVNYEVVWNWNTEAIQSNATT